MGGVTRRKRWRVLAIDPTSKGFAYVVLEGRDFLIDWGARHVAHESCFRTKIGVLCDRYAPNFMVLEGELGSRRGKRARARIVAAGQEAAARTMATVKVSQGQVRQELKTTTKWQVAKMVAHQFPELKSRLPKPRRLWMTEDDRMNVFDALSFALSVLNELEST